MAKETSNLKRLEIFTHFEGVNSSVGDNLFKKGELSHIENARSTVIGTIEKRQGTRRLGSEITATANYGILFYNEAVSSTNKGFYRISTVSGLTKIYYMNNAAAWTALTDTDGINIFELGTSTTQFDITNPAGSTFRYTYDDTGTDPDVDSHLRVGTTVVINAQNFTASNNGTFIVTGVGEKYFDVTNASGIVESNKTLGTGTLKVNGNSFSRTFAEKCCFLVNGDNDNIYITDDGTTVVSSTVSTGHLYNSPKARKIKFFKNKLYLADFTVGSVRKKNGVMMSSMPVGIVSLADGDHDSGVTTIKVTDTKYINATDSLDVYRGNTKIETLTITAKTEDEITVNATANAINSSDEFWVANTFNADKIFRWANNEAGGIAVKEYDTFYLGGSLDSRIKLFETIGDVLMIGTNDNLAIWDDYNIKGFDLGIGCVSDNGYIKSLGSLFFLGYDGIFQTSGDIPKLISAKVEKYIDGATKSGLEAAAMGRKGYSVVCAIGDVTLYNPDGSTDKTLSDVVLEYNIRTQSWYVHTGIKASEFATYISSTDVKRLEFSSTETAYKIMELFNGETDDNSGDKKEILFRMDSSNISLSKELEKISYVYEIIIESERGSDIKCFVSLDKEPFYEIEGTARKGATIMKITNKDGDRTRPPRCRIIKVSIRDFSKQICKVSRVALTFAPSNEEEQQRS